MALPARPYDPLYDVTYTVSGPKDHYRQQTVAGGFMIERAPDYPNMFSELPHFPATTFRLKNSDKVPGFVDRTYRADAPDPAGNTIRSQPDVVAGQQRFKYFRRPLLTAAQAVIIKQAPQEPAPPLPAPIPEPASKTVGTQSDYRESEAQTTPWEPDIVLSANPTAKQQYLSARHNCEGPELLQLKDLKFGDGLPPGLQEIKRIEKMREKRAFEATLPPINDLERLPLRQRMIEQWEGREWDEREEEILSVQDERLNLINQALQAREEEIEEANNKRVEERKTHMLQQKAPQFAAIQANRIKTMRQLIEARKYVERHRKLIKPTIVEKYANFGSTTYAPVQREGRFPETKQIETEGFQPATLQGLAELEQFLPKKLITTKIIAPLDAEKTGKLDYKQRQDAAIQKDLKSINDLLNTARSMKGLGFGDCWPAPLKDTEAGLVSTGGATGGPGALSSRSSAKHRHKPTVRAIERPDTPELPAPTSQQTTGEKEAAIILIQRLLRGRAAQNAMYEGKTRRMELIKELQLEKQADAILSRPEDRHPAMVRLDAMLGTMVSQLAAALTTQDDAERAERLQAAIAAAADAADTPLDATLLHAAAAAARSRTTTPLRAADLSAPAAAENVALDGLTVSLEEAEAAAVKIQAAFKGHKARQDVAAMRARGAALRDQMVGSVMPSDATDAAVDDQQLHSEQPGHTAGLDALGEYTDTHVVAVTKIQAVQRGRIARKQVVEKRKALQAAQQVPAAVAADAHAAVAADTAAGESTTEQAVEQLAEAPAAEAQSEDPAAAAATASEAAQPESEAVDRPAAAQPAEQQELAAGAAEPAAEPASASAAEPESQPQQLEPSSTDEHTATSSSPAEAAAAEAELAAAPAAEPEGEAASDAPAEPAAAEPAADPAADSQSQPAADSAAQPSAEPSVALGHEFTLGHVGEGPAPQAGAEEDDEPHSPALHAEATLGAVAAEPSLGAAAAVAAAAAAAAAAASADEPTEPVSLTAEPAAADDTAAAAAAGGDAAEAQPAEVDAAAAAEGVDSEPAANTEQDADAAAHADSEQPAAEPAAESEDVAAAEPAAAAAAAAEPTNDAPASDDSAEAAEPATAEPTAADVAASEPAAEEPAEPAAEDPAAAAAETSSDS